MRFVAEIIGSLALLAIFSYGLYRISLAMDEMAEQKRKSESKPKPQEEKHDS